MNEVEVDPLRSQDFRSGIDDRKATVRLLALLCTIHDDGDREVRVHTSKHEGTVILAWDDLVESQLGGKRAHASWVSLAELKTDPVSQGLHSSHIERILRALERLRGAPRDGKT